MFFRQEDGIDSDVDAQIGIAPDCQQFDDVAQIRGVRNIFGREIGNALDRNVLELHAAVKGNRRQNCNFAGGIFTFNVGGRISLGVTVSLRLFKHRVIICAAVAHFCEHVICRAVDDA